MSNYKVGQKLHLIVEAIDDNGKAKFRIIRPDAEEDEVEEDEYQEPDMGNVIMFPKKRNNRPKYEEPTQAQLLAQEKEKARRAKIIAAMGNDYDELYNNPFDEEDGYEPYRQPDELVNLKAPFPSFYDDLKKILNLDFETLLNSIDLSDSPEAKEYWHYLTASLTNEDIWELLPYWRVGAFKDYGIDGWEIPSNYLVPENSRANKDTFENEYVHSYAYDEALANQLNLADFANSILAQRPDVKKIR